MGPAGIGAFLPLQAALPPGELCTQSLEILNLLPWRAGGATGRGVGVIVAGRAVRHFQHF